MKALELTRYKHEQRKRDIDRREQQRLERQRRLNEQEKKQQQVRQEQETARHQCEREQQSIQQQQESERHIAEQNAKDEALARATSWPTKPHAGAQCVAYMTMEDLFRNSLQILLNPFASTQSLGHKAHKHPFPLLPNVKKQPPCVSLLFVPLSISTPDLVFDLVDQL